MANFAAAAGAIARSRFLPAKVRAAYALVLKRLWRFLPTPVIAEIPAAGKMLVDPWDFVDSRLFFFQVWEPSITEFVRSAVRPGTVAIDIGANIGYYTLLLSRIVGAQGKVYAVEPAPEIRARLEQNIAMNGLTNVITVPYGISDHTERRAFVMETANRGASYFGEPSESGIELRQLRDVLAEGDLGRVSFVKFDVEGMEGPVLRNLLTLLPELAPDVILCGEVRYAGDVPEILEEFGQRGFQLLLLENDYKMWRYADAVPHAPQSADTLGPGQHDIVMTSSHLRHASPCG